VRLFGRLQPVGLAPVPDVSWREVEFLVVDLETTGLDPRRDELLSFGAVVVAGGRLLAGSAEYGLARPQRPVPPSSTVVHTLRDADLAAAPPLSVATERLAGLLEGRLLVAHCAWVEREFLEPALAGIGRRLAGPHVDTAALARACDLAGPRGEPELEGLARRLGLPVHGTHHALGDAVTTGTVLLALATRLERSGRGTARDLWAVTHRDTLPDA
jgi:DNA polymerase III subunit epsilon